MICARSVEQRLGAGEQFLEDAAVGDMPVRPPRVVDLDVQNIAQRLGVAAAVEIHGIDERAVDVEHDEMRHGLTAVIRTMPRAPAVTVGSRPS